MEDKKYDVRFLPLFEEDLSDIVTYIAERLKNPAAANKLVDDVESAIMKRSGIGMKGKRRDERNFARSAKFLSVLGKGKIFCLLCGK